jgi:hypothetical protein
MLSVLHQVSVASYGTPHIELYEENIPDYSCNEAVTSDICFIDEAWY